MNTQRICILGGGGFVGTHLTAKLAKTFAAILIPGRRRLDLRPLDVLPSVTTVEADIHDPATLDSLFKGVDVVINLVGILHGTAAEFEQAHCELPAKVVAACRSAGVKRLLHMSALGASVDSASVYQQTKARGEAIVLAATDLNVTVFRPSVIFGPDDHFLNLFAKILKLTKILPLANPNARLQPVHLDDVTRAFAVAINDPTTFTQVYTLCGNDVFSLEALVRITAKKLGLKRAILPLGEGASYAMAWAMEWLPGPKIMTRDNHYALQTDNVAPDGTVINRFGTPLSLSANLDYLRHEDSRSIYALYRCHARR
jgi:uncharacterized protein YbjT (DUF2867 family)